MSQLAEIVDPGEAIAEAIVEFLNAQELSLKFTATKPDDTRTAYSVEDDSLRVIVTPINEEKVSRIGRGGEMHEFFTVAVAVVRQLTNDMTRTMLANFLRQINIALRGNGSAVPMMAGHHWSACETLLRFDPTVIQEDNTFRGVLNVRYSAVH